MNGLRWLMYTCPRFTDRLTFVMRIEGMYTSTSAAMPSIRMTKVNRSVNRTVALPAWLNAAALERNINFLQVLQDALKSQIHLRHFGSSRKD